MTTSLNEIMRVIDMTENVLSLDAPIEDSRDPCVRTLHDVIASPQETIDHIEWEEVFHQLPRAELELLFCMLSGLKPSETMVVMGYPSISRYYTMTARLRKEYREVKVSTDLAHIFSMYRQIKKANLDYN